MHIPDGFVSPKMYLPAFGAAGLFWFAALRGVRARLDDATIPRLAVLTATTFILMTLAIPLPGGTSVHASGIAAIALPFGVGIAYLVISLVLFLQAALLGAGGMTSFPLNALALGLVGSAAAVAAHRGLRRVNETAALFMAGWLSVNAAAVVIALALGVQPLIAHRPDGTPLYFPFGLSVTLPALVGPHLLVGVGEGVWTVLVWRFLERLRARGNGS